ncbi:MAG: hypothetical protein WBA28_03020 [Microbacteriaceae bacterium]
MTYLFETPSITPTTDPEFDVNLVTPGPLGFTVIAVVAIAAILLILDMTRRIRRNTYRGIVQLEILAEAESALKESSEDTPVQGTEQIKPEIDSSDSPEPDTKL